MEFLTVNLMTTGKTRRATWNGRKYLVAGMTLIVPGVLPGSRGPGFYSPEQTRNSTPFWDGVPLTARHPFNMGKSVSAKAPGVWERQGLGKVRNPVFNKKLAAEGWFDEEKTQKVDKRIYEKLINNEPFELSTGLDLIPVPAEPGSTYKGRPFEWHATNQKPDHVAVLMDERGACSMADGCGVLVNCSGKSDGEMCDACKAKKAKAENDMDVDNDTFTIPSSQGTQNQDSCDEECGDDDEECLLDCMEEGGETYNSRWPQKRRDSLDKKDFAGPHESFPIESQKDVESATKLAGHADDPSAIRSKIKEIAERKGLSVPDSLTKNYNPNHDERGKFSEGSQGASADAHSKSEFTKGTLYEKATQSYAKAARAESRKADEETKNGVLGANVTHQVAASMHRNAADLITKAGSGYGKDHYSILADRHMQAAAAHEAAAKSIKADAKQNRVDNPSASKLTKVAYKATDRARETKDPRDHEKAYHAHGAAADAHAKIRDATTNDRKFNKHDSAVDDHKEMMAHHMAGEAPMRATNTQGDVPVDRKEAIAYLTTNCEPWKGEEEVLNKFNDEKLAKLVAGHKQGLAALAVVNAATKAFPGIALNEMPAALQKAADKKKKGKGDDEDDDHPSGSGDADGDTTTNRRHAGPVTDAEWFAAAPASVRRVINHASKIEERDRINLINSIVVNVKDENKRVALVNRFAAMDLDEIRDFVALLPAGQQPRNAPSIYLGASGFDPHVTNSDDGDADDILPNMTYNWEELSKSKHKTAV